MKHFYITLFFIVSFFTAGFAQNEFITTWETTTADESITIPTTGSGYNYTVDWGDGTIETGFTGNASHSYATAGTHTVKIIGDFPRIYFNNSGDKDKILSIDQWGIQQWTSMANAFQGCANLILNADDTPDLSAVTNLSQMFRNAFSLVDRKNNIENWDVSTITDMSGMFQLAPDFNEKLEIWDVGSVTNFSSMFEDASDFNQNLNNWNIGERVIGTIVMNKMFQSSTRFNRPLNNWDVSKVTNMESMFDNAHGFNQPLILWDVGEVTNMKFMFLYAWRFNQTLGDWDISSVRDMSLMLDGTNLSIENYDATLIGWATDSSDIPENISFRANSGYCLSTNARTKLTSAPYRWDISDGGQICNFNRAFTTTWQTTGANENITIPTTGSGYDYIVDWGDGTSITSETGNATHEYVVAGTHTVKIIGDFPRIYFNDSGDKDKILNVTQWGSIAWNSFSDAFSGCSNLDVIATDAPDLSNVTSVSRMFRGCATLGTSSMLDFSNWDTSSVVVFGGMFRNASNFNSTSITNWDVGKATGFVLMFENAITFNQDISNWNIGENVTGTVNLGSMLIGAEKFDQNLGAWNLEKVTNIRNMLNDTGLSTANYDATLIGWAENSNTPSGLDLGASNLTYCLGEAARNILIDIGGLNWTISDGGLGCAVTDFFVTTWRTTSSERRITIPTTGGGYNYSVDWGDGTIETGFTGNASHSYATSGIHTVRIIGDFPRIYFYVAPSNDNILSIEQWGTISWTSMREAFATCQNLVLNADDVPDLSLVEDLSLMFLGASTFVDNKDKMNSWDISNVRNLERMFESAASFNEPLHNWDTSNVENMDYMFYVASSFDQSLGDWNLSNVFSLLNILSFSDISSENYDATLIGWAEQSPGDTIRPRRGLGTIRTSYCLGTDARRILTSAPHNWSITDQGQNCDFTNAFITTWQTTTADEDITIPTTGAGYNYIVDWGDGTAITSETGNATHTYTSAGAYEVKIIGDFPRIYINGNSAARDKIIAVDQWGTQKWTSMENAFTRCSLLVINATDAPDLSLAKSMKKMFEMTSSLVDHGGNMRNWDVSAIEDMREVFDSSNFNENISTWNVSAVKDFSSMFFRNTSFNQNLDSWDTSAGEVFSNMFRDATAFNEAIGSWNTEQATSLSNMFNGATAFNQDISAWDVKNVRNINNAFDGATAFDQDLGSWDISSLVENTNSIQHMFSNSGMSTTNYDNTLIGWARLDAGETKIPVGVIFDAENVSYCLGEAARTILTSAPYDWIITDGGKICPGDSFITTWTVEANESITIPTRGDGYNYSVDWGDGNITQNINGNATHEYVIADTYSVQIYGNFPQIDFSQGVSNRNIQTIEQWGTQEWRSMERAFYRCYNLVINATDVPDLSNVTSLNSMFFETSSLVDNGGKMKDWDVSNVTSMRSTFFTSAFNENINDWDVSNVTDFSRIFQNNSSFNQPLDQWQFNQENDSDVIAFHMFFLASAFNQDISRWDTSQFRLMTNMFQGATEFNQNLESWDISNVEVMDNMFTGTAMSQENYDKTLIGWATLETEETKIPNGLTLDADVAHCLSVDAVNTLTSASYNWTINDLGNSCPGDAFVITWSLGAGESIIIPVDSGLSYDYTIDWGDDAVSRNQTGEVTHTYIDAGTYTVSIIGEFPAIRFNRATGAIRDRLRTVEQWGTQQWVTMQGAFEFCKNLKLNADDVPDLSQVNDMGDMFSGCIYFEDLKDNIGSWDMSTITNIAYMFTECADFNEDISGWTFNNLEYTFVAFEGNQKFNQDISNWDMSNVKDMSYMFEDAISFNQPVGNWTLGSVESMEGLFRGTTTFNQDLSSWDISSVTNMSRMFNNSGLSQANYDATLIGWATLETGETQIPANVTLDADVAHCLSVDAVNTLTSASYDWTINDLGNSCPGEAFITTWTVEDGDQITIPNFTNFIAHDYNVDWGDGTISTGNTSSTSHTYLSGGTYTVSITGNMPTIFFGTASNTTKESLQTIEQWGNQKWEYLSAGFAGCVNLKLNADDTPDLSAVTTNDISSMFNGCDNFEDLKDNIGNWDMSQVHDISFMFFNCPIFNEDISGWSFDNLTGTTNTFVNALSFNQNISNWDVSNLRIAADMFKGASSFNQELSSWDISSVTDMTGIFIGTAISQENYDNTLIGWATLENGETTIPTNLTLDADATYCLAESARNTLTSAPYNWIITDGGLGCVDPVITLLGDDPQIIEKGDTYTELGAEVTYGAIVTINATSVNTDQVGSYTVTYDATNTVSGATATQVTRTVEVVDTTAPVITLNGPNPQIIELGDPYIELGATTDDGSPITLDTFIYTLVSNVGTYSAIYFAEDAYGNSSTVFRTVEVVDTTAPVITLNGPNPQIIELGDPYIELGATTDDGSPVTLDTFIYTLVSNVGTYSAMYFAADANGNSSTVFRTVEVVDTTAPIITLNGADPQTIELGAGYSELGATTDDGSVVSIDTSEFMDAIGSYNIYYDATDAFGNASVQITRAVNVVDTTNPTVVCQNITVQLDNTGNVSITAAMIDNGSSDLSGIVSLAIDVIDFDCATIGDNTVILTVTDVDGNSDMCMATVTVEDAVAPEFDITTVPTDMEVPFDSGDMYTLADFTGGVVVTDNCGANRNALATTITQSPVAGTLLGAGDHVITLIATDDNANEQTTTFTITVTDAILSVGENTEEVFTLYPNPAKQQFKVSGFLGEAQVTLSDINGRTLRTTKVINNQSVSITDLSEGVYLITIEQDNIYQTIRLIKN